jgi:hypothetical protein
MKNEPHRRGAASRRVEHKEHKEIRVLESFCVSPEYIISMPTDLISIPFAG